jgi:4-hydroxy-4-methyl-2-oxoglutarate aldolase
LGDDDGVVVVPLEQAASVLAAAQAHLVKEEGWVSAIRSGVSIPEMFALPSAG